PKTGPHPACPVNKWAQEPDPPCQATAWGPAAPRPDPPCPVPAWGRTTPAAPAPSAGGNSREGPNGAGILAAVLSVVRAGSPGFGVGERPGSQTPELGARFTVPTPEAPVRSTPEPVEPTKVRINVVVEPDELRPAIDRTARKLSREVRVPGFRKGKVPRQVIEARIGRET